VNDDQTPLCPPQTNFMLLAWIAIEFAGSSIWSVDFVIDCVTGLSKNRFAFNSVEWLAFVAERIEVQLVIDATVIVVKYVHLCMHVNCTYIAGFNFCGSNMCGCVFDVYYRLFTSFLFQN